MSPFYRDIGIWFWGENMGHIDFKIKVKGPDLMVHRSSLIC